MGPAQSGTAIDQGAECGLTGRELAMHDEARVNDGTTIEATFCFVDIAGYTALTDTHGELAAADLVDDFAALIRTSVEPLGHLQSLVGDCAFFVFSDPVVAKNALLAHAASAPHCTNVIVSRYGSVFEPLVMPVNGFAAI